MSDAPAAPTPSRSSRWLLFLAVALAILGAKLILIDRYGSDLPFWDQWNGEGARVLRPYLEDRLTVADLFAPHNEHRPVFTRLWSIAAFELSGRQWDARVQMLLNALLHVATALLLVAFGRRVLPPVGVGWFAALVVLFFSISISWENSVGGFQSQFYFVLLFSTLHLGGTLLTTPGSWRWRLAPLAGIAALFSMASGFVSAAAIVAVTVARGLRDRRWARADTYVVATNAVLVIAGIALRAPVPGHDALKAAHVGTWADAFLHQFSWPVISLWAAPLGLLPSVALFVAWLRRRIDGPVASLLLAANAWFVVQAGAIAYARGGQGHGYASRYADVVCIGILLGALALAYLATTASAPQPRRAWLAATFTFVGVMVAGLMRTADASERESLSILAEVNANRIATVRDYLVSHDPAFFKKIPWEELPFTEAHELAGYLDDPTLRPILPASVRPPLKVSADASTSAGFSLYRPAQSSDAPPQRLAAWASDSAAPARFASEPIEIDHARVTLLFRLAKSGVAELKLVDEHGVEHAPLGAIAATERWKRLNFSVTPGRYRLTATSTGGSFAFTQPITNTWISNTAARIVTVGPWLVAAAILLGFATILVSSSTAPSFARVLLVALGLVVVLTLAFPGSRQLIARYGPGGGPPAVAVENFTLFDEAAPNVPAPKFAGAAYLPTPKPPGWFGTYVGGDSFTGTAISNEFIVTRPQLHVPVLGYPNARGNRLVLETVDADHHALGEYAFDIADPGEAPVTWSVNVSDWLGLPVRLRLVDRTTGHGGWIAVGAPLSGALYLPPTEATTEAIVLGGIALLTTALLLLRAPRVAAAEPVAPPLAEAIPTKWIFAAVLVFAALFFVRKSDALLTPQFWAEDGVVFFTESDQLGWRAWLTPYAGYLHLIPRAVAALGSCIDPCNVPALYATASYLGWCAIALSFLSPRVLLPGRFWLALCIVVIPQSGEVFFNLCNLQWGVALLLLRQLILRPAQTRREALADFVVLTLAAFTGPFSIVFLPLFAWRAWSLHRGCAAGFEFALVALAAAAHLVANYLRPWHHPGVTLPLDVIKMSGFVGMRTLGVFFVGWDHAQDLGLTVRLALAAALVVLLVWAWLRAPSVRARVSVVILTVASAVVLGPSLIRNGSFLWDSPALFFADRYLFLPRVLLAWTLLAAVPPLGRAKWPLAVVLAWVLWMNRSAFVAEKQPDLHWRDNCHLLLEPRPSHIPILPEGWFLDYPGRAPKR